MKSIKCRIASIDKIDHGNWVLLLLVETDDVIKFNQWLCLHSNCLEQCYSAESYYFPEIYFIPWLPTVFILCNHLKQNDWKVELKHNLRNNKYLKVILWGSVSSKYFNYICWTSKNNSPVIQYFFVRREKYFWIFYINDIAYLSSCIT